MKYIEYTSKSKYWNLWIQHSVVIRGEYILSYEMETPLWKWKFKIYNKKDWDKMEKEIKYITEIKDFDILKYEWVELEWVTCFEALNTIEPMPTIKQRTKAIMLWIIIAFIYWLSAFLFWYYGFTMSEEEFLEYKQEICV